MKCARCGHQWRLSPEDGGEAAMQTGLSDFHDAGTTDQSAPFGGASYEPPAQDDAWGQRAMASAAVEEGETSLPPPAWESRQEQFGVTLSTLSQPEAQEDDAAEPESPAKPAKQSWWSRLREGRETPAAEPEPETRKPLFTGRITPAPEQEEEPIAADYGTASEGSEESEDSWTERLRSWQSSAEIEEESEESADEAEAAIRQALKTALEESQEGEAAYQPVFGSKPSLGSEGGYWSSVTDTAFGSDQQTGFDTGAEALGSGDSAQAHIADSEDEEPHYRLTGRNAKAPIFGSRDDDGGFGDGDEEASQDLAFQHDVEDVFHASAQPQLAEAAAIGARRHDGAASEFDSLYDEQFEAGGEGPAADDFDRETAALQAELESTDIMRYGTEPRYGGLATAAAWAVFLSVVSGIALAFVGLRQDIMTALPGTASLYQRLGFKVADAGVDFADVNYRWTVSEGKPMIEVTGQVINVTDRTVNVPRVLVNVRDADSVNSVKATANVPTDTLGPRESANFTLEFLSPPRNVNQIELEFDKAQ